MKRNLGKKIKNKKATIGLTLTWIIAFFIILFIILMLVLASLLIAVKAGVVEKLKFWEKDTIAKEGEGQGDLTMVSVLSYFLNLEAEGKKIKDRISKWADSKDENEKQIVEREFNELIKRGDFECYLFNVKSNEDMIDSRELHGLMMHSVEDSAMYFAAASKIKFLSEENNLVEINIYVGKC